MLVGLGASPNTTVLDAAVRALPDCYSQELSNCLDHQNVNGLPAAECQTIVAPYADPVTGAEFDKHVNALPLCKPPSMVPYVGGAFALGVFLTIAVLRR